jgi:hypothetical protein
MQWSVLTEKKSKRMNLLHEHDDENKCGVYWLRKDTEESDDENS